MCVWVGAQSGGACACVCGRVCVGVGAQSGGACACVWVYGMGVKDEVQGGTQASEPECQKQAYTQ